MKKDITITGTKIFYKIVNNRHGQSLTRLTFKTIALP